MNVPPWVLQSTISAIVLGVLFGFRHSLSLIKDNKLEMKELVKSNKFEVLELVTNNKLEMKELRVEIHKRVSLSETQLLNAIRQLPRKLVSTAHCDGKQEVWSIRFENLIKTIETSNKVKAKADHILYTVMEEKIDLMVTDIAETKKCMLKLAQHEKC